MRLWQSIVFTLGALIASASWSATVAGLYAVRVPVADQSPAEMQRAAREGLSEVVVRLTGRHAALEAPALKPELDRADQWLSKFSFEQVPPAKPGDVAQTRLLMSFDPQQVAALVTRAGLPMWGENRPAVLVWLVVDAGGRQFGTAQSQPDAFAALVDAANRRGLPILQSMGDLEDETALPPDGAWNFDAAAIGAASARYRADAQLIARVKPESAERWSGEWLLLSHGQPVQQAAAGTPAEFMAAGVALAAEQLSTRYAVASTAAPVAGGELEVSGIASLQDQQALLQQLSRTSGVRDVFIHRVEGDRVWLRMNFSGSPEQLADVLGLGGRLQAEPAAPGQPPSNRYHWR